MSKKENKAKISADKAKTLVPLTPKFPSDLSTAFDDAFEDFRGIFRRDPFSNLRTWRRSAIEPFLFPFPFREAYADIIDSGTAYKVSAEVPGIPKEKIDITVSKDSIEISGEARVEHEDKKKDFVHRERRYSRIYKRLTFPEEVIPEKAVASVNEGILTVDIPKKSPTKEPNKHKVKVA